MCAKVLCVTDIQESDTPYELVADFANEFRIENGEHECLTLPEGLQQVLLVLDLDSEYNNGGLWQYFSNRTSNDGVVSDNVYSLVPAISAFGAFSLAELIKSSIKMWERVITEWGEHSTGEGRVAGSWLKKMHEEFDVLDEHMGEIYQESLDAIAKYIVTNAHLFCYP